MNMNKHIVVATLGLMAIGIYRHYTKPNVQLTKVFIGSFVFLLALSVADLAGGQFSKVASALAMLALLNGILTELPSNFLATADKVSRQQTVTEGG